MTFIILEIENGDLRRKMDEEELNNLQWNRLLNYFTINNVQLRRDRKKEALNSWRPIVEAILVYVRERHDYFATLQMFHSGSYYDRTKVGEPDEFDLMLVMENAVFYELKLPGLSNPPTGRPTCFLQLHNVEYSIAFYFSHRLQQQCTVLQARDRYLTKFPPYLLSIQKYANSVWPKEKKTVLALKSFSLLLERRFVKICE